MIYINKREEPQWLIEFKRKYKNATYDSKEFKENISKLNELLISEQKGLCAYCCCKIDKSNSHNEHIEPRNPGRYASNKSLDYDNIVASCNGFNGEKTCGNRKKNEYDKELFVSPLNENCEDVFSYTRKGFIEGDKYTIDLLNLNSYKLTQAREAIYSMLETLDVDIIRLVFPDNEEYFQPFENIIRWYIRH